MSSSQLIKLAEHCLNFHEDYLRSNAVNLLTSCRAKDVSKVLGRLKFLEETEYFNVNVVYLLTNTHDLFPEYLVQFLDRNFTPLVRQLAARRLILSGNFPELQQLIKLYNCEGDILIKLNYSVMLFWYKKISGIIELEYLAFLKRALNFIDPEIQREAQECLEFTQLSITEDKVDFEPIFIDRTQFIKILKS